MMQCDVRWFPMISSGWKLEVHNLIDERDILKAPNSTPWQQLTCADKMAFNMHDLTV